MRPLHSMSDIEQVLHRMGVILDETVNHRSRIGYFAAMYRRVTHRVKEGIDRGDFEDADRMSRFDAAFAAHYFHALDAFQNGQKTRQAWQLAFDATASEKPLILQHLLLGMNAHIYLDLGIAAAEIAPGDQYRLLKSDFDRINQILFTELDPTQNRVGKHSPWLGLLDFALGQYDEALGRYALKWLRQSAWEFGARLAQTDRNQWPALIDQRDGQVANVAREVLGPGFPISWLIPIVRCRENEDVAQVIRGLA